MYSRLFKVSARAMRSMCVQEVGFLFVALVVGGLALPAFATQIPVLGDTYFSSSQPSVNFGPSPALAVGNGNTALIQFYLPGNLPAGTKPQQVAKAVLNVYVRHVVTPGEVVVKTVKTAWYEAIATYLLQPVAGDLLGSFTVTEDNRYVALDITAQVQAWLANPSSSHGVEFSAATANLTLDSKENDVTSHGAWLEIALEEQGPAGATGPIGPAGSSWSDWSSWSSWSSGSGWCCGCSRCSGCAGGCWAKRRPGNTRFCGNTGCAGSCGATWTDRTGGSPRLCRHPRCYRADWSDWSDGIARSGWTIWANRAARACWIARDCWSNWACWTSWTCWSNWTNWTNWVDRRGGRLCQLHSLQPWTGRLLPDIGSVQRDGPGFELRIH